MQCGHLKRLVLDCIFSGGFPPTFCSRNGAFKMQCGHLKRLVLDCIFSGGFPPRFFSRNGAFKMQCGRLKRLVLDCMFSGGFPPRFCSRNGAFKMQFGESKGRSFGLKLGAGFLRQDFVQDMRPSIPNAMWGVLRGQFWVELRGRIPSKILFKKWGLQNAIWVS